jgi:predicted phage terminase large subunit-like protein
MAATRLRVYYGQDPEPGPSGFYWPGSPAKRRELMSVKRNHPSSYESIYQCRPGQREGSIFLEDDFVYYRPPSNLSAGVSDPEVAAFCSKFHTIIAGWDTAMEAKHDSDFTVGIAAGLLPCSEYHRGEDLAIYGECEPHLDVYLLDLVRKKLQWGDLASEFRAFHRKWRPARHVVEKKASGIQLYQSMPAIGIDVEGVPANQSKRARAVSGTEAGSTQGWFRQHRVWLPDQVPWLSSYKTEMKDFTGDEDASDDQVDATVHLVNHAISFGGAMGLMSSEWEPDKVDSIIEDQVRQPEVRGTYIPARAELLSWIQFAPDFSDNPFSMCCAMCTNNQDGFCSVQKRNVASLDFCEHFHSKLETLESLSS